MLARLREGHAGADKCKSRASLIMYWPNINADIEAKVRDWHIYATYAHNKPREPLLQHEMPTPPWSSKVEGDIFDFGGRSSLALVDYFSKYPELIRLTSTSASAVIDASTGGDLLLFCTVAHEPSAQGHPTFNARSPLCSKLR